MFMQNTPKVQNIVQIYFWTFFSLVGIIFCAHFGPKKKEILPMSSCPLIWAHCASRSCFSYPFYSFCQMICLCIAVHWSMKIRVLNLTQRQQIAFDIHNFFLSYRYLGKFSSYLDLNSKAWHKTNLQFWSGNTFLLSNWQRELESQLS